MRLKINDMLIPKGSTLFFDEPAHKYTNELGLQYTSCTTVIGKYECHKDFDAIAKSCERIGRNPKHPKYHKYKGKRAHEIKKEWADTTKVSCDFGSDRHNFLEGAVKSSTNYNRDSQGLINDQLYTIDHIIANHNYGRLKLSHFAKFGIDKRYPDIYNILSTLHNNGFHIYAEIGVYDNRLIISGLIDILAVNHDTGEFIIVDWKTNKAPIRFDAGYYEKDQYGLLDLSKWKPSDDFMMDPISHLADSVGNHYTLQLSLYAYLVETFGYKFRALLLCHIRPIEQPFIDRIHWDEKVELYRLNYMKDEIHNLVHHHRNSLTNAQTKLLV